MRANRIVRGSETELLPAIQLLAQLLLPGARAAGWRSATGFVVAVGNYEGPY